MTDSIAISISIARFVIIDYRCDRCVEASRLPETRNRLTYLPVKVSPRYDAGQLPAL
jgi:hypothetical protein